MLATIIYGCNSSCSQLKGNWWMNPRQLSKWYSLIVILSEMCIIIQVWLQWLQWVVWVVFWIFLNLKFFAKTNKWWVCISTGQTSLVWIHSLLFLLLAFLFKKTIYYFCCLVCWRLIFVFLLFLIFFWRLHKSRITHFTKATQHIAYKQLLQKLVTCFDIF